MYTLTTVGDGLAAPLTFDKLARASALAMALNFAEQGFVVTLPFTPKVKK